MSAYYNNVMCMFVFFCGWIDLKFHDNTHSHITLHWARNLLRMYAVIIMMFICYCDLKSTTHMRNQPQTLPRNFLLPLTFVWNVWLCEIECARASLSPQKNVTSLCTRGYPFCGLHARQDFPAARSISPVTLFAASISFIPIQNKQIGPLESFAQRIT